MGCLAALTFWLQRTAQPEGQSSNQLRHDPDFFADVFTVKRFNVNGTLQHTIRAQHMQHYADDGSTEVFSPEILYHTDQPTKITADNALIDEKGDTVLLKENVRVQHRNVNGADMEIRTQVLTVLPNEEIAHTSAAVTITQGQSVIQGTGLEVNNKTRTATLSGRVHGTLVSER